MLRHHIDRTKWHCPNLSGSAYGRSHAVAQNVDKKEHVVVFTSAGKSDTNNILYTQKLLHGKNDADRQIPSGRSVYIAVTMMHACEYRIDIAERGWQVMGSL